jgi:hypothetical protein
MFVLPSSIIKVYSGACLQFCIIHYVAVFIKSLSCLSVSFGCYPTTGWHPLAYLRKASIWLKHSYSVWVWKYDTEATRLLTKSQTFSLSCLSFWISIASSILSCFTLSNCVTAVSANCSFCFKTWLSRASSYSHLITYSDFCLTVVA